MLSKTTLINKWLIAACILSSALIPLNSTMLAAAMPDIGKTFHLNAGFITLCLIDSYLLVNLIFQVISGRLGDSFGRIRVLNIAHLLLIVGVVLSTLNVGFTVVVVSRLLMALGGSVLVPNTIALICTELPKDKRAYVLGILSSMLMLSVAFGPLVGGFVTQYFGWRMIFVINLPFLLMSWVLISRKSSKYKDESNVSTGKLSESDFFVKSIYKDRKFIIGNIVISMQNLALYGLLFALPFLLVAMFDSTPLQIGKVIFLMTICMAGAAFVGGKTSNLINTNKLLGLAVATTVLGLVILIISMNFLSYSLLLVGIGLIGMSVGVAYGPGQALIMSVATSECSGLVSGISSTIRYLGGIIGVATFSMMMRGTEPGHVLLEGKTCLQVYLTTTAIALFVIVWLMNEGKARAKQFSNESNVN